jgi:hypothetical protein
VGGLGPDQQLGRADQCAHIRGDKIITPLNEETPPKYPTEDDVPEDHVNTDKIDVPNDVDGDHTHPDEGGVPKTPEEGDIQKSLDRKMSKKMSQTINLTFQTETSAGMTKNQLARYPRPLSTPLLLPRLTSPRWRRKKPSLQMCPYLPK